MGHKANLDILRSFAVCFVVIVHLLLTLHTHGGLVDKSNMHYVMALGHAGVLAFFVHTSLVLMYSLERMHRASDRVIFPFYVRRFFRIYPLAIVAIILTLLLHIPWKTWDQPKPVGHAVVIANLFLVQNLITKQQVLAPLWSLPYEVQMYIVLPFLYLLAARRKGSQYLSMVLLVFCSLGAYVGLKFGHLNMAAYVPCFLSGVLCYSLRHRVRATIPAFFWAPFFLILTCAFLLANPGEDPTFWTGWIFCIVLGLAINAFRDSEARSINLAANKVALYSYGIYLIHIPFLYLIFLRLKIENIYVAVPLFVALTAIASVIGFHAIESPFIDLGKKLSSSNRREANAESGIVVPAP